jgi:hypothetical protein
MKLKTKQWLMQKMMERWVADNPEMMEDIEKLTTEVVLFNTKWGTKLQAEDLYPRDGVVKEPN